MGRFSIATYIQSIPISIEIMMYSLELIYNGDCPIVLSSVCFIGIDMGEVRFSCKPKEAFICIQPQIKTKKLHQFLQKSKQKVIQPNTVLILAWSIATP